MAEKKEEIKKKTVAKKTTKKEEKEEKTVRKSGKKTEESIDEADNKEARRKVLLEKAKALAEGIDKNEKTTSELKKKVKNEEEEKDTLVPIEDYLKSSIHLGTRVITPDMKSFVYKRRADGLAVFNTNMVDDKLREAIIYFNKFAPEDVVIVCKREAGWKAVELFSQVTGIRAFTKKYPAGILTNPNLRNFLETELIFIIDPWLDKNALKDAIRTKTKIMSICDTNNYTQGVNVIVPGNNKSGKSIGMILYLIAKHYVEKRGLKVNIPEISEWVEGWETLVPPK